MKSPLEQFNIINIKLISLLGVDLSFNNILVPFSLILLFFLLYVYIYFNKLSIIPNYIQNIIENIYIFLILLIKQQTGSYGLFWFPFIFCLFNFILFSNLLSLIPFGIALTSHLILIFLLSCTTCISIFIIGLLRFNLKFLHIFIPQCPFVLLPILIPIEIFSYLIRLFSLSIRLAANILAGHTLVHIIVTFLLNVSKIDIIVSILFLVPLFLILILEFGVALLQAYVFTVLVCIYLGDTKSLGAH
jgi:F-type H+-transporting ATPase subunit a